MNFELVIAQNDETLRNIISIILKSSEQDFIYIHEYYKCTNHELHR